ncbi:MAG: hypothetical protein AAGF60_04400 [Pseudomonadota bacterium]
MFDIIVALIALGQGSPAADTDAVAAPAAAAAPTLQAEAQTPTGKFTTATEVRPILSATKANWVVVRLYDGKDYLYVTHLWSWRCGLAQMEVAINGGPFQVWPMPPCLTETAAPNALPAGALPYATYPPGAITDVSVRVTYDDLSTDEAAWPRNAVLLP